MAKVLLGFMGLENRLLQEAWTLITLIWML